MFSASSTGKRAQGQGHDGGRSGALLSNALTHHPGAGCGADNSVCKAKELELDVAVGRTLDHR